MQQDKQLVGKVKTIRLAIADVQWAPAQLYVCQGTLSACQACQKGTLYRDPGRLHSRKGALT